jgi:hypothetical protein
MENNFFLKIIHRKTNKLNLFFLLINQELKLKNPLFFKINIKDLTLEEYKSNNNS